MLQGWASYWETHALERGSPWSEEESRQGWESEQETVRHWLHLTTDLQVHLPGRLAAVPSQPVETEQAAADQVADLLETPYLAAGREFQVPLVAAAAVEASAVAASVDVVAVAAFDLFEVSEDIRLFVQGPC